MRPILPVISAAALAVLVSACATTPGAPPPLPPRPAPPPPPPTPMEEFGWSTRPGGNVLNGVISYRPAAGQTWSCSGLSVALTPETSYSRNRMMALYGSGERALHPVAAVQARSGANPGMDYSQFVRSTTCDAQSNFAFRQLPDGAYYIIARMRRTAPPGAGTDMVIMQRIELRGAETIRIVLPQPTGPAAAPRR